MNKPWAYTDRAYFSDGEFLDKKFRVGKELGVSLFLGICNFAVNLKPNSLLMTI